MKRLLFPLISALTLSTSVHTEISDELHKKCSDAQDYAGWVNTNKKFSRKFVMLQTEWLYRANTPNFGLHFKTESWKPIIHRIKI